MVGVVGLPFTGRGGFAPAISREFTAVLFRSPVSERPFDAVAGQHALCNSEMWRAT